MANSDSRTGLTPIKYLGGVCYTGQTQQYFVDAATAGDIFIGDLVSLSGSADSTGKFPGVVPANPGDTVIGVATSVALDTKQLTGAPQDSPIYRQTLTERVLHVADDPNLIFEVQADGAGITAADVGQNANLTAGTGNTFNGLSGDELDVSTIATTNTLDCQILRVSHSPDNEIGAFVKVLVRLNNHQFVDGVTGV